MTNRVSEFSGGGGEEGGGGGGTCVFALPNLIFLRTKGSYLEYENEWVSKERCNPFLIISLPVNTLEQ